jgi:hypothetical protein
LVLRTLDRTTLTRTLLRTLSIIAEREMQLNVEKREQGPKSALEHKTRIRRC